VRVNYELAFSESHFYLKYKSFYSLLNILQTYIEQDAHLGLSQRDRAAGFVIISAKSGKTATGKQYFTDIIGLSSNTVT